MRHISSRPFNIWQSDELAANIWKPKSAIVFVLCKTQMNIWIRNLCSFFIGSQDFWALRGESLEDTPWICHFINECRHESQKCKRFLGEAPISIMIFHLLQRCNWKLIQILFWSCNYFLIEFAKDLWMNVTIYGFSYSKMFPQTLNFWGI